MSFALFMVIVIVCAALAGCIAGVLGTLWLTRRVLLRRARLAAAGRQPAREWENLAQPHEPPQPWEAAPMPAPAWSAAMHAPAPSPSAPAPAEPPGARAVTDPDPFGTRVVRAASRHPGYPGLSAAALPAGVPALLAGGLGERENPAAILVVHPGNGQATRQVLAGDRSSWRVGAVPGMADIVIPEVGVDVLIGRNGDVWTAASEGPIHSSVTLDAVTLPTVPMPWPPERKLRVGSITMTLERITEPPATLEDHANQTHASLDGRYAARANRYALALARSGRERAESVAAAALACFDSRLLDPARGAALATLNMTLALRSQQGEDQGFDKERTELAVGIAGFDRDGRLRAAASFPIAVWAVTSTGPVQLGESSGDESVDSVEVAPVPVRDGLLRGMDRPLLLIAGGPDLSVIGSRLHGLSTLNTTPAQLAAAVVGSPETDAPIAVAAAARAAVSSGFRNS